MEPPPLYQEGRFGCINWFLCPDNFDDSIPVSKICACLFILSGLLLLLSESSPLIYMNQAGCSLRYLPLMFKDGEFYVHLHLDKYKKGAEP